MLLIEKHTQTKQKKMKTSRFHSNSFNEREASELILKLEKGYTAWSYINPKERIRVIRALRKAIALKALAIAKAISSECSRPLVECLSQEVLPVLEMSRFCEQNFSSWIAPQKVFYSRPGFLRKKNYFFYEPIGPVAVITPRNFPFSLGMMSLIYLLLAGNTVILKPAEKSSFVPTLLSDLLKESSLYSRGAAGIVPGNAVAGEWLAQNPKIKKIFFFGQRLSGKSIAVKCAENLKPFVLELGGGSTAFVCEDTDLELTTSGLAWSGFYSSGQSCVATERIFVAEKIIDRFLPLFEQKVGSFEKENKLYGQKGCFNSSDIERFKDFIADVKSKGAVILRGGKAKCIDKDSYDFEFTIIVNTTSQLKIWKEEIFGPMVVVQAVKDMMNAVNETNDNFQPLAASIWSKNRTHAFHLAKFLRVGMIWINDSSFGLPNLPWGGWPGAGMGSLFSEFSIHEATRYKWVSYHPSKFSKKRFWWNPYNRFKEKLLLKIVKMIYYC